MALARVVVDSTPPGASVELDGEPAGTTPCTVEVPLDGQPRPVVLRRRGYRPHVGDLRATDELRYRVQLTRAPRRWPLVVLAAFVIGALLLISRSAF